MKKRILLRDVTSAETSYANAMATWGENNQITVRALIKWYDLTEAYNKQKEKTV